MTSSSFSKSFPYYCAQLESGLVEKDAAITTIQPYAVPKAGLLSKSVNISMVNDEEGAVELNGKSGNEHNITVLGTV